MQDILFVLENEFKISFLETSRYPGHIAKKRYLQLRDLKKEQKKMEDAELLKLKQAKKSLRPKTKNKMRL